MKKTGLIVACILCFAFFFGCDTPAPSVTETSAVENTRSDIISTDSYSDIIASCKMLISDGEYSYKDEKSENDAKRISEAIGEADVDTLGYAMHDLNRDGNEELFIMRSDYTLVAMFTTVDGRTKLVDTFDGKGAVDIYGRIYDRIPVDETHYIYTLMTLKKDGTLSGLRLGGEVKDGAAEYYADWYGERKVIVYKDYEMIWSNYFGRNYDPSKTTKMAGLMFVPISADIDSSENKEAVDFSSYDKIIETYKKIVQTYNSFTVDKWVSGEYERGLEFSSTEQYRWYNAITYSGYIRRPTEERYSRGDYPENGNDAYGYDIRDINGDGIEELLLITDQYEIIALFTMKDSKPVILEMDPVWDIVISKQGRIYTDVYYYNGYALDQYVFEIKDGALDTVYHMFMETCYTDSTSHYYKLADGERVEIDTVLAVEEYREVFKKPTGGYINGEFYPYIQNIDIFTFTPAFSFALPVGDIVGKYDFTYMGEDFYIKAYYNDSVIVSLKYHLSDTETATTYFTAYKNAEKYIFNNGSISGEMVFTAEGVWFIIKTSKITGLEPACVHIELKSK